MSTNFHALIIGINNYPKIKRLTGAVSDAQAMKNFLIQHLGVPSRQIVTLLDSRATRSAIIGEFQKLQHNPRIRQGDPVLIFYAGHGGLVKASTEWQNMFGYSDIQVIYPYDCNPRRTSPDNSDAPIPDVTIRALLNSLAAAVGNNITVILDSCYSASGDREDSAVDWTARDAEVQMDVAYDIDKDIIALSLPSEQKSSNPRRIELPLYTDQYSHVLLAACGSNEKAWERSGKGQFTTELLKHIQTLGVNNITYENLMTSFPALRSGNQTPHCYGVHKSRILFNLRVPRKSAFVPADFIRDTWILQAGEASDVTLGSIWELHNTPTENSQSDISLQALKPSASSAALVPFRNIDSPSRTSAGVNRMYARQIRHGLGHELLVYFSPEAKRIIFAGERNRAALNIDPSNQGEIGYVVHDRRIGADIAVEIDRLWYASMPYRSAAGSQVTFTLLSAQLRAEQYKVAKLKHRVPARKDDVDRILFAAARWHWHLKRVNQGSEAKLTVPIEFLKLGVARGGYTVPSEGQPKNLMNKGVVDIKVKEDDQYGVRIRNQTKAGLYVRAFYFAADDFSIVDLFGHNKARGYADPDIPQNGQRTIGDGADGGSLLSFKIAPEEVLELGFIKVFWSTKPLELDSVQQDSPFVDGAHLTGRWLFTTTPEQWGAECIVLVQRAK